MWYMVPTGGANRSNKWLMANINSKSNFSLLKKFEVKNFHVSFRTN